MSDSDKRLIVDTFITVIDGLYAHLPLKKARYGIDPVQRLRLLRDRCGPLSDEDFHAEMNQIVTALRDAHTRYQGAGSMVGKVAMLPFLVETYGSLNDPHYVVSKTGPAELVGDPAFVKGVELLSWSGVSFDRAVSRWADWETGGRRDARRARALETLTFRSLEYGPLPDEEWVIIGYRSAKSRSPREVRIPWRVITPGKATTPATGTKGGKLSSSSAEALGAYAGASLAFLYMARNPAAEAVRRAKQLLFAPEAWETTRKRGSRSGRRRSLAPKKLPNGSIEIPSLLPDAIAARVRPTASGEIGHLRIWSFSVDDDEAFVMEVVRLVEQMPTAGLIIDLRGNPGGLIWAAERILQLFTPHRITPTRFSLLATDLTRVVAAKQNNPVSLSPWAASLNAATSTGEPYSQPLPVTDREACNDIGQRYSGPVVAVVDANTYSAGDLFAAGFVDNGIGSLLCVGEATGAGGANVWDDGIVRQALAQTPFQLGELPLGVHFTLAVRRATRIGACEATPIEDLGVVGESYVITRDDLLHDNRDLVSRCAEKLAAARHTALDVHVASNELVVTTVGLDRIDLTLDSHPWRFKEVADGETRFAIDGEPSTIEVVGWVGADRVQRRRLRLGNRL